jgi:hypothetical protein
MHLSSLINSARLADLFAIDPRSLLVFRVGLGSLIILDLLLRAGNLRAHYTDAGVFPRAAALEYFRGQHGRWSLHLLSGSFVFQVLMFILAATFAAMLLVGYHPRVAAVASWLLLVSLHTRMPVILFGHDTWLRTLLFWAMFVPLAASPMPRHPTVSIASAGLLMQIAVAYFVTGMVKVNPVWSRGHALFYALSQFGSPLATWLFGWPRLLRALSKAVPWFEISGALLLFCPIYTPEIRVAIMATFVVFHVAIGLSMRYLGLFPLTCVVAWTLFIPTLAWDHLVPLMNALPAIARPLAARFGAYTAAGQPSSIAWNLWVASLVGVLLIYPIAGTSEAFRRTVYPIRKVLAPLDWIANAGMLWQNWKFFSSPRRVRALFIFQMNLADGRSIDMISGEAPRFDGASALDRRNPLVYDHRWWYYFLSLTDSRLSHTKWALDYYLRRWNSIHPAPLRATAVVLHLGVQQTYPPTDEIRWNRNTLVMLAV